MEKITAAKIYFDTSNCNDPKEYSKWHKVMDTPIVPRKLVEMIIEKCNVEMKHGANLAGDEYYDGLYDSAKEIKEYIEYLLDQLEEDK